MSRLCQMMGNTFDQYIETKAILVMMRFVKSERLMPNIRVSLEGQHFATTATIFDEPYDENMVLHFHGMHVSLEQESMQHFLDCSNRQNIPLWLGETGENKRLIGTRHTIR